MLPEGQDGSVYFEPVDFATAKDNCWDDQRRAAQWQQLKLQQQALADAEQRLRQEEALRR